MRKLSSVERTGLCLGIAFVLIGGWLAVVPKEFSAGIPATNANYTEGAYRHDVTKLGCRIYGVLAVGMGLALGALAVYPWKK